MVDKAEHLFLTRLSSRDAVYLRTVGYRTEDTPTLQEAANHMQVAARLRSVFPHPYELKDADFWVNFNRFNDGWRNVQLDNRKPFNLPIVVLTCPEVVNDEANPIEDHQGQETQSRTTLQQFAEVVIGNIGFVPNDEIYELGYWLTPEYWGKGIMKAAVIEFINHIRKQFPQQVNKVHARVAEDNIGSEKALLNAGFVLKENAEVVLEDAHPICKELGLPNEIRLKQLVLDM